MMSRRRWLIEPCELTVLTLTLAPAPLNACNQDGTINELLVFLLPDTDDEILNCGGYHEVEEDELLIGEERYGFC